ncbi:prephenate dehydrogenase [Methanotorris formicicus]|uniref:Prephenate dehydrogenase n=1 Tax=Methanotorris formicicus Mc-S-70 TaxID=647171 RepID=H1L082_9EURY|nr:prephenate dehydrogenase [Methanotorris formicicus]EHP85133.1 Prephenate dehydrogenase [Methanotorris formicicus Mc-S-70]
MKNYKVSIIGGTDGLGKWFAKYLKSKNFDVTVTGRDIVKGKSVEKELGVKFTNNNIEAAKEGDIVIVAVPINVTERVIREVAPHVREGCLLMDITSIKEIPSKTMEEYAKEGVTVVPTHPMFGPSTPSLMRQVVILTPSERHKKSEWFRKVKDFLEKEGARVIVIKPEEHDRIMGVVQGLTHFAYISLGATLKELGVDIKESRKYASPIYELMIYIIGRIIGQNPYLYADIQMHNPQIKHIHETFIGQCNLIKNIVERKDREEFVKLMKEAAKHFGNEAKRGVSYSDKAVFALTKEMEKLSKMKGKDIGLRHIYSGNVHYGILKDVDGDYIIIEKNGKEIKLSTSNVMVMEENELKKWKDENLPKYHRDVSILFKKDVDENVILDLLKDRFDVEIMDIYEGEKIEEGFKSVTFRVYAFENVEEKEREFLKIIENIGGKRRFK